MRKFIFPLAIALALNACATREPQPNLTLLKWQMVAWHNSGDYARLFADAASEGERILDGYLRGETPQNFAVVLDIDETALSNWPYLERRQFAITTASFAEWTRTEHGLALEPVRRIFARARARRIPVFFITGRDESLRSATIQDLHEAGFFDWNGLFLRPDNYADSSIIPFKSGVRKKLTEDGWDIILNVGDQYSDLEGGYARHRVKLPNPFYYLP